MISSMLRSAGFRFSFPIVLLVVLSVFMDSVIAVIQNNWGIIANLPYILLFSALLLCYSFKQGREAMVCIAMFVSYVIIQSRLQVPLPVGTTLLEVAILTTLLPVSLLTVFLFNREGMNSRAIWLYIATLALFVLWSYITLNYFVEGGFDEWTDGTLYVVPEISKIPLILVLYSIGIACFLGILVLRYNQIIHAICYTSMLLAGATFVFFDVQYISSTLYTLIGVLIIIYVTSASHQMAFTDSLTLIPSRRALDLELKHLGRKYSIAMLDVDHFKKFNDTYGHDTGDEVLKMVASRLMKTQGGAKVYRFGGEEFTILFKGKYAEQCEEHLEDIREQIANYEMVIRNEASRPKNNKKGSKQRGQAENSIETVKITVSLGVSDSRSARNPIDVIKLADEGLYKAKKAGRNCLKFQCP